MTHTIGASHGSQCNPDILADDASGPGILIRADDAPKKQFASRPSVPLLTHVFRAEVTVGQPAELGVRDGVRRRLVPITGGPVEGSRLRGQVLPAGADWQGIRDDGTALVDARYDV